MTRTTGVTYPLAVDLDGTLLKADTLFECFVASLFRRPREVLQSLAALSEGRAALKRRIDALGVLSVDSLPLRQDFLEYLAHEREHGRELHLVTAADQVIADAIAARTGLFDSATGSRDGLSLRGAAKEAWLAQRFPEGFSYAGDEGSDFAVWKAAKSIVVVGASPAIQETAVKLGLPIEREFIEKRAGLGVWLKALRAHQWAKNFLIFVPLVLAHNYTVPSAIMATVIGFVCLSMIASGTYLINDLTDLTSDRLHVHKRNRPIARGDIGIVQALLVALGLIASGLVIAAFASWTLLALLLVYIAATLSYSLHFKRVPMLDVFILGSLYTLRIFMGMVLLGAAPSSWLLAFSLFFFVSLATAKRHSEIVRGAGRDEAGWIRGRSYHTDDEPLMLAFGVSSSIGSILILFLYIANDAYPTGAYRHPDWLWVIGFLIFLWVQRIWFLSHRGILEDDPVVFAIRDATSLFLGALVGLAFLRAVL